jgi:membrane protease YdiL (CAAX protease family)
VKPGTTFWVTTGVLAGFNLARAAGAFGDAGDLVGLVVAAGLVLLAVRRGLSPAQLGLGRDRLRSGAAWGGAAFGLVLVVVVAAALVPATSGFLEDDRARIGFGELVFEVVVSILVLTVIPEELAFRGVLLGSGIQAWGRWRGVLLSSAVFGLWHVAPTLGTADDNARIAEAGSGGGLTVGVVAGAVLATFAAGLVFSWLRLRSGSVLAPMLAHLGTNGVTLAVAWFALR